MNETVIHDEVADENILAPEVSDEDLEGAAGGTWQKPDARATFWSWVWACCAN